MCLRYFIVTHSCDIRVHQEAKDISADGALVDFLELIGRSLKHLDVYTKVTPTPPMDEIVVMILVGLLTIVAVATKELIQGQLGASALPDLMPHFMQRSKLRGEASRRA